MEKRFWLIWWTSCWTSAAILSIAMMYGIRNHYISLGIEPPEEAISKKPEELIIVIVWLVFGVIGGIIWNRKVRETRTLSLGLSRGAIFWFIFTGISWMSLWLSMVLFSFILSIASQSQNLSWNIMGVLKLIAALFFMFILCGFTGGIVGGIGGAMGGGILQLFAFLRRRCNLIKNFR